MTEALRDERLRNERLRNRLLQSRLQGAVAVAPQPTPAAQPTTQPEAQQPVATEGRNIPGLGQFDPLPPDMRLDPEAAAMVGGMLGGVGAAPFALATGPAAPVVELGGIAVGGVTGRALANTINEFAFGVADNRNAVERALGTAEDMKREVEFGAVGAGVGRVLRGAGGALARTVKPKGNVGTDTYNAFQRLDITQSPGAVSGQPLIQGAEQTLSKLPFSAGITGGRLQRSLDDLGKAHGAIAENISAGALTRQQAGEVVEKGVTTFVDRFAKVQAPKMFKRLNLFFRPEEQIQLSNSMQAMAGKGALFSELPEIKQSLVHKEFEGWLTALERNNGVLNWDQLKELRSFVGRQAAGGGLTSDIPRGEWKRVYGALTADMRAALATKGPKALETFDNVNATYAEHMARIDNFLDNTVKNPEIANAFNAVFRGAPEGNRALVALKKTLQPDEWQALVATKHREMGLSTPGSNPLLAEAESLIEGELRVFSPKQYLTRYKAMSPEARGTMFNDLPGNVRGAMDDLLRVSSAVEKTAAFRNPSGTGPFNIFASMLQGAPIIQGAAAGAAGVSAIGSGGILAAAPAVIAPFALPPAMAVLFTREPFIRWLAKGVQIAPTNFNGIAAHLGRLAGLASKEDPATQEQIAQFSRGLERAYKKQAENLTQAPEQRSRLPGQV